MSVLSKIINTSDTGQSNGKFCPLLARFLSCLYICHVQYIFLVYSVCSLLSMLAPSYPRGAETSLKGTVYSSLVDIMYRRFSANCCVYSKAWGNMYYIFTMMKTYHIAAAKVS
jgi:hypothetical protein